jgi:hypothetical protein
MPNKKMCRNRENNPEKPLAKEWGDVVDIPIIGP